MLQIAIIADDLTGALDAAAPFAGGGRQVVVATSPEALGDAVATGAGVVSVSTRSREIPAAEARARVAGALARLPAGATLLKKIDSRMKGNIAAELDAFGDGPMLICPSIPELGRLVRDGSVMGEGVEVPIPIAAALGHHRARATVPDVARQSDIARALDDHGAGGCLVGARGLAQALAASRHGATGAVWADVLPDPVTIVVGSSDPVTLAQLQAFGVARPDLHLIEAPDGAVPAPDTAPAGLTAIRATRGEGQADRDAVAARLAQGAAPWLRAGRTALVTGGATAEAVFDALDIGLLTVAGEVLPGLPVCRWRDKVFITKSGGFGQADALLRLFPATARAGAE